jgi:phospholipid transport system substrate-binding protein
MLTRRKSVTLIATLPAVVALPAILSRPARASPAGDRAVAFIKETGAKLVAAIDAAGTLEQRRQVLGGIIDADVDVNGVARFCLGRFWNTAPPDQQQQYLKLFRDMLVVNISVKLGDYRGVTFDVGTVQDRDTGEVVATIIKRPNNPPTNIQWLVANAASDPKIIDVIAEGTSLRITQRDDYASFLSQHGGHLDALLEGLRRQVSQNG